MKLVQKSWVPSLITASNISAGFISMILAADGRYDGAVYLLVLAIVLDTLDGRLARWLNATSEFGRQLDSLGDVVSSGAAPALLIYLSMLRELGTVGVLVAVAYVLAGMFRLARFNMLSDAHTKAPRTMGVPIPIGAGYLMATVLMRDQMGPTWAACVVLLAAVGMVSRWKLPELRGGSYVTVMLLVGICNYLALVAWPNWFLVAWWNIWNVFILLAARSEDRRVALQTSMEP